MFLGSEATLKGEGMGRRCLWEKIPEEDVCYSWEASMEKVKLYTISKKNNNINTVWLWVKTRGGICNLDSWHSFNKSIDILNCVYFSCLINDSEVDVVLRLLFAAHSEHLSPFFNILVVYCDMA